MGRSSNTSEYQVPGEFDPLIKTLANSRVADLRTEQPTLDDVLMRFYEGGAE